MEELSVSVPLDITPATDFDAEFSPAPASGRVSGRVSGRTTGRTTSGATTGRARSARIDGNGNQIIQATMKNKKLNETDNWTHFTTNKRSTQK